MSTPTATRHRPPKPLYALAITPLLRWLIAHHSVPAGQPWRTRCQGCCTSLWPAGCAPSGRCHTCRTRLGAPPYLLELAALAATGLLVVSGTRGWELAAYLWWTTGLLVLAYVDAAVLRLPHRLTAATTVGTVVLLAFADNPHASWWTAAIGAAVLSAYYAVIHLASHGDLGLGDVAVAVPIGIALGWHDWRLIVAATVLGHVAAVASLPLRRRADRRHTPIPMGTYLIAASIVTVTVAAAIR